MPDRPRSLVIFGCGYVGAAVANAARDRGVEVAALTRNRAKAEALRASGVRVIEADLASTTWHADLGGPADWILNTVSSGGGDIATYRRSYVEGMRSIVAWARDRAAAETFVYTSSTSVYPQGGGVVVTETDAAPDGNERAAILLEAEQTLFSGGGGARAAEAQAPRASRGYARAIVLRLAGIYGPGRHHLLEQVRAGEVSGRGDHRLNLIHRDDVVTAILAAFDAPAGIGDEVLNVSDGASAPKREVCDWLAAQLGIAAPRFTGVATVGRRRAVTPDRIISNAKLGRVLGWAPRFRDFREGYRNILSRVGE